MDYGGIKSWPEEERPRERLLRFGAHNLSTAQLLSVVLRTGGKKKSALELARELLSHFSGLREMDDAAVAELSSIKGMGTAKIAQIKAACELGRRFMRDGDGERESLPMLRNSGEVYRQYRANFFGLKKERFLCVLLDAKNRAFKETVVSEGTLTSSPVHPREVFRYAIKEAAASVLFIHNHPSGDPQPSRDDIEITERLADTGRLIGISVLDHVIIADGSYTSLREYGCFTNEGVTGGVCLQKEGKWQRSREHS